MLSDINSMNFITKEWKRPEQGGKIGKSLIIYEKLLKLPVKLITSTVSTEKVEQNDSEIPSSNNCWKSPQKPSWEDAGILANVPFTLGYSLWGAEGDPRHSECTLQRHACSLLSHVPPEDTCYRKKEVFIELLCILWSRIHGNQYWEGTHSVCSKGATAHIKTAVPFENHSPVSATKTSWWSIPTNALCSWFSVKVIAEAIYAQPLTICFSSVPGRERGDKERLRSPLKYTEHDCAHIRFWNDE